MEFFNENNFFLSTGTFRYRDLSQKRESIFGKILLLSLDNRKAKVISMGHRENNPRFLINFIREVSGHEYASSDSFSTAIFYCLYMKKKTFVFGSPMSEAECVGDYKKSLNHVFLEKYPELKWENFNHVSHYNIAVKELGVQFKNSPKKLKRIFGWNLKSIIERVFQAK